MIIKSVTAGNFGSLKNATLDFTAGMNIISGPNESAKSTWHAALVTAICGLRRGRGLPRKEEKEFKDRFLPWQSTSWDVSAVVVTDSGEKLSVSQDLANLVSSQVLKLGKNVTAEFENEGSPDLSSLVGLRRDIFGSTASIRQADIRISAENAKGLQGAIQSAISTAGSGSAAAAAIASIVSYKQQHVGIARTNAVKPLQLATEALEAAEEKLTVAKIEHSEYLLQLEQVENLDRVAKTMASSISATEIEIKSYQIYELESEVNLILSELEKFGAAKPQENLENSGLDQEVAQAIADWKAKPIIGKEPSPSSNELLYQLQNVLDPIFDPTPSLDECKDVQLRNNVRDLERLESDLKTLRDQLSKLADQSALWLAQSNSQSDVVNSPRGKDVDKGSKKILFVVGGIGSTAAAIASVAVNQLIFATLFGFSALIAYVLAFQAEAVKNQDRELNVAPDVRLATNPFENLLIGKEGEINEKNSAILESTNSIIETLLSLGFPAHGGDFRGALAQYIFETQRDEVLAIRKQFENQISGAKEVEANIARNHVRNSETLENLRSISLRCGIEDNASENGDLLVGKLNAWLANRDEERVQLNSINESWVKRETILKGRTFEEMKSELAKLRAGVDYQVPSQHEGASQEELNELLTQLRLDETKAVSDAAGARALLKKLEDSNNNVADCEQEVQEAKSELARIVDLARILDKTVNFLETAQTNVHRNIAPILQDAICARLPAITNGRYSTAQVDPQDLSVTIDVRNGLYINANLLSYGTTEQIYLLLRIALIDHLTGGQESCPIICDDITVHADSERTVAILTLLKEISKTRQVIMFSQEAEVLSWGVANLKGDHEQVKTL